MPTTYAHYRFGKEVTEALPRGLQNTIEYHRDLYDIGLHGPDILFYYKALKATRLISRGIQYMRISRIHSLNMQ